MSNLIDTQFSVTNGLPGGLSYKRRIESLAEDTLAKTSNHRTLPNVIFRTSFGTENRTTLPSKEAVQTSLDNALEIIDGCEFSDDSDCECDSDYEVDLCDARQRPAASTTFKKELLKDDMAMLSRALAALGTESDDDDDFSESSCEEDDDFESFGF